VTHHRRALQVIGWAVLLDMALGLLFALAQGISYWDGLYWSVTTATTVGYGDIVPRGWLAHLVAIVVMLTIIPLVSATFSLFTAGMTTTRVDASEQRIKDHVEQRLRHHFNGGDRM
jgi:voltage-gated potassium channel